MDSKSQFTVDIIGKVLNGRISLFDTLSVKNNRYDFV